MAEVTEEYCNVRNLMLNCLALSLDYVRQFRIFCPLKLLKQFSSLDTKAGAKIFRCMKLLPIAFFSECEKLGQ